MIIKQAEHNRNNIQMLDLDSLVPKNHIVRYIEKVVDFEFIRNIVKDYYSQDKGRPAIDPVVLFKIVFIQFIFGIKSMRQTIREIEVNAAYRWFLGFGFTDKVPNYSTFSQNYRRRFANTDVFERIFKQILNGVIENKLIKEENIFIDSTHIKAYANKRKVENKYIEKDYNKYTENLHLEINQIRKNENKKEVDFSETKRVALSKTDPDAGMFHKGEKERQLAYSVQTAVDENGWVLGCQTDPGSMNDNNAGMTFVDQITENFEGSKHLVMDAGYTSPLLQDIIYKKGKRPVLPYQRPKGKKLVNDNGEIEFVYTKHFFKYNDKDDLYICPYLKHLTYRGTNKQGYREYKTKTKDCRGCPYKYRCTNQNTKSVTRHQLEYTKKLSREFRLTEQGVEIYRQRKYTIERNFAICKMNHCLGLTLVRGLKKNHDRNLIIYSVANIKKLALLVKNLDSKITQIGCTFKAIFSRIWLLFRKNQKKQLVS